MNKLLALPVLAMFCLTAKAQDTVYAKDSAVMDVSVNSGNTTTMSAYAPETKRTSPYVTSWKKDGWITLGLIGLNAGGLYLIQNKKELTPTELATKTRDKVPSFDRGNVGYYNEQANEDSYIPFYASFAWPVAMMLVDGDQTRNFGQILGLYIQTMAVTGAMFSITAGSINRSRPLVYGTNAPIGERMSKNSQRSFYAGHTAATAASSFFTAKVFSDMNPDSKLKPVVWVVAAAVPALVGYYRYEAGQHFLSDNIIGYGLGAATGILIPHWHKVKKSDKLSITPGFGPNYQGISVVYKIK
jgi:membrane-associated phospholipid phosphatase